METLNHIGRHELLGYFEPSRFDDDNLDYFSCGQNACGRFNPESVLSMLQIRESPVTPGLLFGRIALVFRRWRVGDRRLSRVPGSPPYAHAPFSDPGGNRTPRRSGVRSAAFRCMQPSAFSIPKDAYPNARHYTYFGIQ